MARLQFPDGEIVGMLDWPGADDRLSPILATGVIDVPDGEPLSLEVWHVVSVDPTDACSTPLAVVGQPSDLSPHWLARGDGAPVDLGFLCDLPADVVVSLSLQWVVEESFQAVTHLAASLRQLTLGNSGLSDAVLSDVARLENLVYLQTWGNRFSDEGVQ
ncbi:MAG TPA: hypothetical protein VGP46_04690, partial [Acidimicrobiales bacterium]|nr:hypothetical protein [Acidimicrobiales bacterium]